MTFDEAKRLLAMAAARDNRQPSQAMAMAWNQDLGDLDFADCVEAMNRHYRLEPEPVWITPQHIRSRVRDIQGERQRGTSDALALARRPEDPAERRATNARGAEACRLAASKAIEAAAARRGAVDPDDPIRDRALRRAREEKRAKLLDPVRNPQMPGLVAQATAHLIREDA